MSKPKAPPAPDYAGAAQAQGAANVEAARVSAKLSNPNITNPYGSQTVTYGGEKVFDQSAYDKAMQDFNSGNFQTAKNFDAQAYLAAHPDVMADKKYGGGDANKAYQHYVDWGKPGGWEGAWKAPSKDMFTTDSDPDKVTVTQTLSPEQQKLFDQDLRISQGLGNLAEGGISRVDKLLGTEFNTSNLPGLTSSVAPISVNSRADQIQTSIDPTKTQIQSSIAGPRQAVNYDFADPQTGIKGAVDGRFDQSGDQVQDALYRKQTRMLDPQYQQQSADLEARLANQGIMPGSEAYNREMDNFARQRDFAYGNARDAAILAGGGEQSRLFGLGLASADLANRANQQEFGQGLGRAQFGNEANAQEFAQNATQAGFNNQAQSQEFGQNLDRGNFANSAVGQQFNQDLGASNQNFNQGLASAQFGNQARQQAMQEQLALRQLPLNEINALRSGSQVTVPQFQQYTGQQVQAAPIFNAAQAQGQADMSAYNARAAQSGGLMGGLFGLGSAALMGPAGTLAKISDKRLKENIRRVGYTDGGLPVYTYNYKWDKTPQMGVMAQDVEKIDPSAVVLHEMGFKMVNYSKVQ